VNDPVLIAISTTIGAAVGGLLKYLGDQRTSIASITRDARKDDDARATAFIGYLQTELARVTAERDRMLTQVLEDRDVMLDAHKTLTEVAPKGGDK
jgi:hypothetical protein